jgi:hypothetical protein
MSKMSDNIRLVLSALLLASFVLLISSPVSTFFHMVQQRGGGPSFSYFTTPEIQQIFGYAILHFVVLCVIWLIPENKKEPNQATEDRRP